MNVYTTGFNYDGSERWQVLRLVNPDMPISQAYEPVLSASAETAAAIALLLNADKEA